MLCDDFINQDPNEEDNSKQDSGYLDDINQARDLLNNNNEQNLPQNSGIDSNAKNADITGPSNSNASNTAPQGTNTAQGLSDTANTAGQTMGAGGETASAGSAASGSAAGSTAAGSAAASGGAAVEGGTAAAEASNPVGWAALVLSVAKKGVDKAKNEVESIGSAGNVDNDYGISMGKIILFLLITIFSLAVLGGACFYEKASPGSVLEYRLTQIQQAGLNFYDGKVELNFLPDDFRLRAYDDASPLLYGTDIYINGVDSKSGLKYALREAMDKNCTEIVHELETLARKNKNYRAKKNTVGRFKSLLQLEEFHPIPEYSTIRTLDSFYENPWPYDLTSEENPGYPHIGDVLGVYDELSMYNTLHDNAAYKLIHKDWYQAHEYDKTPYSPKYDDVNFGEMLAVLSQGDLGNWDTCSFKEFNDAITCHANRNYYYEMDYDYRIVYVCHEEEQKDFNYETMQEEIVKPAFFDEKEDIVGPFTKDEWAELEDASSIPETYEENGHTYELACYYCHVTIKPFSLRSLYYMAEYNMEESPIDLMNENHQDFYYRNNVDMLEYNERYLQIYLRTDKDIVGVKYNEPRNKRSTIYEDLFFDTNPGAEILFEKNMEGLGRSALYYIGDPVNYSTEDHYVVSENEGDFIIPKYIEFLLDSADAIIQDFLNSLDLSQFTVDGNMSLENWGALFDMYLSQTNADWKLFQRGNGNTTIGNAGCIDMCYYMVFQYYSGTKLSAEQIAALSKNYVNGNSFDSRRFLSDIGLTQTVTSAKTNGFSAWQNAVMTRIDNGHPTVIKIEGVWRDSQNPSVVYHRSTNTHFIVAIGYTEQGVIVQDPGSSANNSRVIPWGEWTTMAQGPSLECREVFPS